jgi:hypothetical protein
MPKKETSIQEIEKYFKKIKLYHELGKEIANVRKFFEGYGLQPKALEMSASIKIFKTFEEINDKHNIEIDKKALADAIVDVMLSLDMSVKVYPLKMKTVFVKATYQGIHIYAYQSEKKTSIFDFKKLEERIGKKLDPEQIKSMSQKRFYKQAYERFASNLNLASYIS